MDYETCLKGCVAMLLTEDSPQAKTDIATHFSYPIPSAAEWTEVLAAAANVDSPFSCMEQYELRLSARGIETVLDNFAKEILAIAERLGMPREYVPDAFMLLSVIESGEDGLH